MGRMSVEIALLCHGSPPCVGFLLPLLFDQCGPDIVIALIEKNVDTTKYFTRANLLISK